MTTFPTQDWNYRNVWPLPTGELAVRQSLTHIIDDFTLIPTIKFLGGFTVKNPRTDMVVHFVLSHNSADVTIQQYNEDFVLTDSTILSINVSVNDLDQIYRTGFSYALVEDEIIITSPLFSTYYAIVGAGLIRAETVASVNNMFTAVNVPKGISVGWAGRAVIAEPTGTMWFSDALAPRTYVPQNAINPPGGSIYGLHVNAGGALIVCTTTGVYALPEDAAATGQIVVGVFSKLTDFTCINYDTTCVSRGRVFGLTEAGLRLIDTQDAKEITLDEKFGNYASVGRLTFNDYRDGKIIGADFGPIVTISGYMNLIDMSTGFNSWWIFGLGVSDSRELDLRGMLYNDNGEEVFLCNSGPYSKCGHRRTEIPVASVFGRIEFPAEANPVIRQVMFKSNSSYAYSTQIEGTTKTDTVTSLSPKMGADSWDTGQVYREVDIKTCSTSWAVRTNNVAVQIVISEYAAIIPRSVDMLFKGPGKLRVV